MKNYDLYHARRLGQHRLFSRVVRPGMALLTEREDGSYRRELVRTGFSSPSDGLLWFPDLRDHATLSLLEGVVFGPGPKPSLPLGELVDRALSMLDAPEPPAETSPPTHDPRPPTGLLWTSASVEPPLGTLALVMENRGLHRWFFVARRVATGPWGPTWVDVEGIRICDHVRYWMPIPELPPETEVRP